MTVEPLTISTTTLVSTISRASISPIESVAGSSHSTLDDQSTPKKTNQDLEKATLSADSPISSSDPEKARSDTVAEDDVIVIDWKGESVDPLNPKNWSNRRRMGATLM